MAFLAILMSGLFFFSEPGAVQRDGKDKYYGAFQWDKHTSVLG